jgi:hypothetical protein
MPGRLVYILVLLFLFAAPALADDTVYCPNSAAEQKKQCAEKKAFVKKAEALIAKWEANRKKQATHSLIPWVKKGAPDYRKWSKPTSVQINGVNLPVYGTYRASNSVVYLFVPDSDLKKGLWARYNNKVKVAGEYQKIRDKSRSIMKSRLPNKLAKYKQSLQKAQVFLSQCCGHRWTNDGPGSSPQPGSGGASGNSNSIDLLDVIAPPAQ